MKYISKIIGIILTLSLVFSAALFVPASAKVVITDEERVTALLEQLGITISFASDKDEDEFVTRAELADLIVKLLRLDSVSSVIGSTTPYSDLSVNHLYAKAVMTATQLGVFNGYSNGLFMPDNNTEYTDVLTVLVKALGYEVQAEQDGGYPTGYYTTAIKLGLLKGITGLSLSDTANISVIQVLFYNALSVPLMEQTYKSSDKTWAVSKDKTILTELYGLYRSSGVVTANGRVNLNGGVQMSERYVKIDDKLLLHKGISGIDGFLGRRVVFFYRELEDSTGEYEAVLVESSAGSEVRFNSSDVKLFSNNRYTLYGNNDKEVRYEISSTTRVVYNNSLYTGSDARYFAPEIGEIKLVDADGDGRYDIAFVTGYSPLVFAGFHKNSGEFFDKLNSARNVTIDIDNAEIVVTEHNGYMINIDDIREWDIVYIAQSFDGKYCDIAVSKMTAEGEVEAMFDDNLKRYVTIGGREIELSPMFDEQDSEAPIAVGQFSKLHLDVYGRAVVRNTTVSAAGGYGYVLRAQVKKDIDKSLEFQLLTSSGKLVNIVAASKVKFGIRTWRTDIDSEEILKKFEGPDGNFKRQLVKYKLNSEGNVTEFDIARDDLDKPLSSREEGFNLYYSGNIQYFVQLKTFNAVVQAKDDTVVFVVPSADDTDPYVERKYTVTGLSYFSDNQRYNVAAYAESGDSFLSDVLVVTGDASSTVSGGTGLALLTRIARSVNTEGAECDSWTVLIDGEEKRYSLSDEEVKKGIEYNPGDTIRITVNIDGDISSAEKLFDGKNMKRIFSPNPSLAYNYGGQNRHVYGSVLNRSGNYIIVTVDQDDNRILDDSMTLNDTEIFDVSKFRIYVYDRSGGGNGKAFIGNANDIYDYMHVPNSYSRILVQTASGNPRTMVIYN